MRTGDAGAVLRWVSALRRHHVTVLSLLALAIGAGGVSYAAVTVPAGSVGDVQLKPGAVTLSKVHGDAATEHVLTSPTLKGDQRYTFLVKARWTTSGKTYEIKRAVTLGPGDSSQLAIISGEEVKE